MSTRSNIHFCQGGQAAANIYRHSDGYPEGAGTDMYKFFAAVKEQTDDTRFNDPEYLAAKFVVWLTDIMHQYSRGWNQHREWPANMPRPLAFLCVGVCMTDHGDIEYQYAVHCDRLDKDGFPTVERRPVHWNYKTGKCTFGKPVPIPRPEPDVDVA